MQHPFWGYRFSHLTKKTLDTISHFLYFAFLSRNIYYEGWYGMNEINEKSSMQKQSEDSILGSGTLFDLTVLNRYHTSPRDTTDSVFNDLSGKEWTAFSKSVQTYNSPITNKRKHHGAAYPLSLAQHFINIYSKEGDSVFDPFSGVGTTLDAANTMKRHAFGTELNPDFVDLIQQGIDPKDGYQDFDFSRTVFNSSADDMHKFIPRESIDLIVTSPPYANLLNKIRENFGDKDFEKNPYKNQVRKLAKPYSTSEADFGNLSYAEYLQKMKIVFTSLFDIAKPGAYNVWVVRDYRDLENGIPYVNLHGDLIKIAIETNWVMWDMVIWDQSNQRKLVMLGGKKSRRFYFNIGHSFILVFRKNMKGESF
jgi:DNA modification methylase